MIAAGDMDRQTLNSKLLITLKRAFWRKRAEHGRYCMVKRDDSEPNIGTSKGGATVEIRQSGPKGGITHKPSRPKEAPK